MKLIDLLINHPGIPTSQFQKLAVPGGVSQPTVRDFIARRREETAEGFIRIEKGQLKNRKLLTWEVAQNDGRNAGAAG